MNKFLFSIALIVTVFTAQVKAQTIKVLFDASSAEMAGNADWVMDADVFNLGPNSSGAMVTGAGNEANAQRYPTPLQSNITSSTAETYWKGALSYFAVDLVKQGFGVETLPYNGLITYGVTSNTQDLANYKVFIVDEPNIRFTTSEKTAIMNFVKNGGGLLMISDHTVSDRNNDGWDSPAIWNDLITNNTIQNNAFGFVFDLQNFSQTTSNIPNLPTDPILHGSFGNVSSVQFNNGTSITLNPSNNSTVKGLVYKTGASNTGNTQVMFCASNYMSGKVCGLGDSSPADDGTGDTNDALYSSFHTAVSGSHEKLLVNAVKWLATPGTAPKIETASLSENISSIKIFPNPVQGNTVTVLSASPENSNCVISIYSLSGQLMQTVNFISSNNIHKQSIDVSALDSGFYLIELKNETDHLIEKFVKQ
ncbi:MAG: T9SS type A sorting domain-containing protein [Bacteroidota bacterium]